MNWSLEPLMRELNRYCHSIDGMIPDEWYVIVVAVFVAGSMLSFACFGIKKGLHYSLLLLLTAYAFLIYGIAVFCRRTMIIRKFDLTPFWSYRPIMDGNIWLLVEDIMNVVMFIPIGVLIGTQIKATQKPQKTQKDLSSENHQTCLSGCVARIFAESKWEWLFVTLVGAGLSIGIETLQFVFKKGFAEFDDVFHNTLGCLIGYMICLSVLKAYRLCKS